MAMYDWRKMTEAQRQEILELRQRLELPWHSPPHREGDTELYHLAAACFEHRPIVGATPTRIGAFAEELLALLTGLGCEVRAWCVLPNHYHLSLKASNVLGVISELGRLHGRTSYRWNGEEQKRGRQVWCKAVDRDMRSVSHYWATLNYVHHNPVKHGYAARWQDWPYSSALEYLAAVGRDRAAAIWRDYPLLDYGKGWDDV
jgi:putative transposase